MAARSERNAAPPRSSSVALRVSAATRRMTGSSAASTAQAGGLAERHQAHGGRDQVGGDGLQIGRRRWRRRRCRACRRARRPRPGRRRDRGSAGQPQAAPRARRRCPGSASRPGARGRRGGGGKFRQCIERRHRRARCAWRSRIASLRAAPCASRSASQSRSVSPSVMSPASTAHSMPVRIGEAPVGKAGDSQASRRSSAWPIVLLVRPGRHPCSCRRHRRDDGADARRHRRPPPDRTAPRSRRRGRPGPRPSPRSRDRRGCGCDRRATAPADAGCRDARRCGPVRLPRAHGSPAAARASRRPARRRRHPAPARRHVAAAPPAADRAAPRCPPSVASRMRRRCRRSKSISTRSTTAASVPASGRQDALGAHQNRK